MKKYLVLKKLRVKRAVIIKEIYCSEFAAYNYVMHYIP